MPAPIPQHGRVPPAGACRHATGSARGCPLIASLVCCLPPRELPPGVVHGAGVEPASLAAAEPKSAASASFATRAVSFGGIPSLILTVGSVSVSSGSRQQRRQADQPTRVARVTAQICESATVIDHRLSYPALRKIPSPTAIPLRALARRPPRPAEAPACCDAGAGPEPRWPLPPSIPR